MPKEDHDGQLEIDNIDDPLGERAEEYLKADARYRTAKEKRQEAEAELIEKMKEANIRTFKFKGNTIRYTPGHKTPDKISFRQSEK